MCSRRGGPLLLDQGPAACFASFIIAPGKAGVNNNIKTNNPLFLCRIEEEAAENLSEEGNESITAGNGGGGRGAMPRVDCQGESRMRPLLGRHGEKGA